MSKPIYWHLIDRAFKMMASSGYGITEHNPDQNDPIGAWMSDARTFLAQAQDDSTPPEVECRVARWCPKPRPDEQCIRCNRFADRQSKPQD